MTKETEPQPLTPREALIKLREVFPWAEWIAMDDLQVDSERQWSIYSEKPDLCCSYLFLNNRFGKGQLELFDNMSGDCANIKYGGDWKDSLTHWKEGEDDERD